MEGAWRQVFSSGLDSCQERGRQLALQFWNIAPLARQCYEVLSKVYQEPELAKTKMNYNNLTGIAH